MPNVAAVYAPSKTNYRGRIFTGRMHWLTVVAIDRGMCLKVATAERKPITGSESEAHNGVQRQSPPETETFSPTKI